MGHFRATQTRRKTYPLEQQEKHLLLEYPTERQAIPPFQAGKRVAFVKYVGSAALAVLYKRVKGKETVTKSDQKGVPFRDDVLKRKNAQIYHTHAFAELYQ